MRVFFDNAATTPLDADVAKAMYDVMTGYYGNPSSIHQEGRQARTLIERARKAIAAQLNAAPGEIFFTSGGTEADNMALQCAVCDLGVRTIITSKIEHHAILHTAGLCHEKYGTEIKYVKLLPNGHIDLNNLENLLAESQKGQTLVSLMHANNELGNITDIEKVGALCAQYGAYFHSDTVQTIGHLPIDVRKAGLHFLSASAHKFNGPKGVGFIYINSDVKVKPLIHGGSQERNMRGGTENLYGIVGMAKALEIVCNEMDAQKEHIQGIKDYLIEKLEENIPGVSFNGDYRGASMYTVLNVNFSSGEGAEMMLFSLDIEGIAASGGSACSSGSSVGSHVIQELGAAPGTSQVRFSFGKYNTKEEVDFTIDKLKEILKLEKVNA